MTRRMGRRAGASRFASPAALLPLVGATIADLVALEAVFALAIAAAMIQVALLRKLRNVDEALEGCGRA